MSDRVFLESGHMTDAPDRSRPRFPQEAVPRVTKAVGAVLDEWRVGPGDLVLTQGARGADLIVAEKALARGASVRVLLAKPPEEFRRSSVDLPGTDWSDRFDRLLRMAERVDVLPEPSDVGSGESPYERANAWALEQAFRAADGRTPRALVVWDGERGDGAGGTAGFVAAAEEQGVPVRIVSPREAWRQGNRPYWERQFAPGPKRMLALDGGGMRGLITLEVLRRIEETLGAGSESFRLADYFDYIAGTSTGAIIAAGLSLGHRVGDIADMYTTMASRVFRRRFLPARVKSFYKSHRLSEQLQDFYGGDVELGDDRLQTLLLIVLHRADTDSIWPLSNNSWAKYNDRSRPDCNLRFPLWQVVRGSAAAPIYFPPETIRVGTKEVLFQDGGVTPFNSPALLLFQMATARQYRLGWRTGVENLLLVSVGTGFAPAVHENLVQRQVNLFFNARNLLKVIMNGSGVENDRLCRVLGQPRVGPPIDAEFDAPLTADPERPVTTPLFAYARYTADLTRRGLDKLGLPTVDPAEVGKLDAVGAIHDLQEVGRRVARAVSADHFAGFPAAVET